VSYPVIIWIAPLYSLVLAPVVNVSTPVTQLVPALAVITVMDPELVAVPVPDDRFNAAPAFFIVNMPDVMLAL
jgi:hypothetical protein